MLAGRLGLGCVGRSVCWSRTGCSVVPWSSCWGWLGVHVLLLVPAALAEGDVVDTTELLVLFLTINVVGKGGKMQLYC